VVGDWRGNPIGCSSVVGGEGSPLPWPSFTSSHFKLSWLPSSTVPDSEVRGHRILGVAFQPRLSATGKAFSFVSGAFIPPAQTRGSWRNNCRSQVCRRLCKLVLCCKTAQTHLQLSRICRSSELRCFRCLRIGSQPIRSNRRKLGAFLCCKNPETGFTSPIVLRKADPGGQQSHNPTMPDQSCLTPCNLQGNKVHQLLDQFPKSRFFCHRFMLRALHPAPACEPQ